mgnify:CR=1 FL=1
MGESVIIKRHKVNTYLETDYIYNEAGQEIAKQQNLNIRNRYGAKKYKYNGQILTVKRWERINT